MANVTLGLTGNVGTTALGALMAPGLVSLSFPVPRLQIAGVGAIPAVGVTLPAPTLAIAGTAGFYGSVVLTLPDLQLSSGTLPGINVAAPAPALTISGTVGVVGSASLTLPSLVVQTQAPDSVAVAWPSPTLAVVGQTGVVGQVALYPVAPSLVATGDVPLWAGATLSAPVPVLSVAGSVGSAARVDLTLRQLALAVEGATGTLGTVVLTLPVVSLDSAGYQPVLGVVALTLPSLQVRATGRSASAAAASTVVMHTESQSLTTYSNYPFNSFARFNGVMLGACDAGVFALTGDTDNGTLIQAAARVGISDFGSSHLKRVDRVYVGYRTTGDMVLRVITEESQVRDYRLAATGWSGLHGNHARLGKGLEARYWQFELRNQNGADFDLNVVELKPTVLGRRVGGKNA